MYHEEENLFDSQVANRTGYTRVIELPECNPNVVWYKPADIKQTFKIYITVHQYEGHYHQHRSYSLEKRVLRGTFGTSQMHL